MDLLVSEKKRHERLTERTNVGLTRNCGSFQSSSVNSTSSSSSSSPNTSCKSRPSPVKADGGADGGAAVVGSAGDEISLGCGGVEVGFGAATAGVGAACFFTVG